MNKEQLTNNLLAAGILGLCAIVMIQNHEIRHLEKDVHYLKIMELDRTVNDLVREAGKAHVEVMNERKSKKEH